MDEIKLQSLDNEANTHKALHSFAATLTYKVRELEKLESEYKIVPGQATEILTSMIESYVYTVINIMRKQMKAES